MHQAALDNIGKEIGGRYRILARLGEGGMGTVYRAEQISLKRKVALKLLKPELSADAALVRRFNVEAELAAKLNHPNTVTLYDFGQDDDGSLFIAMEFVEGESLRAVMMREGPIPVVRAIHISEQVCASISDAHSHGIIHRDLKPDNVMLTTRGKKTDVVRVLDFGIAKLRDAQGDVTAMPMTQAGDLLGTPQYMAPEQIRGEKVDARTDVYAMGAMIYEIVTGRLPFEAPTLMAILSKHLTEMPVPPNDRRADLTIPPPLSALVMNALAKKPDDRPASMDLFGDRLREVGAALSGPGLGQLPTTTPAHFVATSSGLPSVVSPPPGVPRRLSTPIPHLTPQPQPGAARRAPIEQSLAEARDSIARQYPPNQPGAAIPAPVAPGRPPVSGGAAGAPVQAPMSGPSPYTTPPPRQARPAPSPGGGKGWIWALVAVIVIAGAGAGAFFALRKSDKKTEASEPSTPDDNNDNNGSGSGSGSNDVPSLHDWDLNSTEPSKANGPAPIEPDDGEDTEVWSHPTYPIAITHPAGFQHSQAGLLHTLTGTHRGHRIALHIYATMMPSRPTQSVQASQISAIVREAGGVVLREGEQLIAGAKRYTAIYESRGAEKGQTVAYTNGNLLVLVAFAAAPGYFGRTKKLRANFFNSRVDVL